MKSKKAITLIELTVGIIIMSIIVLAANIVQTYFFKKANPEIYLAQVYQNTNYALETILKQVREGGYLQVATNSLKIRNPDKTTSEYYLDTASKELRYRKNIKEPDNYEAMIKNVQSFYLESGTGADRFRAVYIKLKAKDPQNRLDTESYLASQAFCRVGAGLLVRLTDAANSDKGLFPTIQDALDAAVTGDIVQVSANQQSSYKENLEIKDKSVTILSAYDTTDWSVRHFTNNQPDSGYETTIDGSDGTVGTDAIKIEDTQADKEITIDGFTIQNAKRWGIYADGNSAVTIKNNKITQNNEGQICYHANTGFNRNIAIENNTITGFDSSPGGVANRGINIEAMQVVWPRTGVLEIKGNTITKISEGVISCSIAHFQTASIKDNKITDNIITNKRAGIIYYYDGSCVGCTPGTTIIENNFISRNSFTRLDENVSQTYGLINCWGGFNGAGGFEVRNNTVTSNTVSGGPARWGVDLIKTIWTGGSAIIKDNYISNNHSISTYGTIVINCDYIRAPPPLEGIVVSNNIITGNTFADLGGGVHTHDTGTTLITMSHNTISDNYASGVAGYCEWFHLSVNNAPINILNNRINNNEIQNPPGIYAMGFSYIDQAPNIRNNLIYKNKHTAGMLLWRLKVNPLVINNTITENKDGKGIEHFWAPGEEAIFPGIPVVKNCIIWDNLNPELAGTITDVSYSDIEGLPKEPDPDTHNFGDNPKFEKPNQGDFRLKDNSDCIDAGQESGNLDPEDLPSNPGMARLPALGTVRNDMGTYGGPGAGIVGADPSLAENKYIGAKLPGLINGTDYIE